MKKLLAMTLALILMVAMAVPAIAEDFGHIDDVRFDDDLVIELSYEELVKLAEAAGVEDPLHDAFGKDDLEFRVTLGSSFVKTTVKYFDDSFDVVADTGDATPTDADITTYTGNGIRITFTPVNDYTVKDREVRFEYYFLRSNSGDVIKTEAVKGSFMLVHTDLVKGEIAVLAGEDAPVRLSAETDIISEERFAEGVGKKLSILSPDGTWKLSIKSISDAQKGINVTYNTVVDDNIAEAFPKVNFQCVNFRSPNAYMASRSTLDVNIDADAMGLKGPDQKVWLYTFDGKTLTLVGEKTVNAYEQALTVTFDIAGKTTLGSYYISDTELQNTGTAGGTNGGNTSANPNTGANDFVGVAAALGVVALVAAAAVSVSDKLRK